MSALLLKIKPTVSSDDLAGLVGRLGYAGSVSVYDYRTSEAALDRTNAVMTLVFSVATYIAMFLCLFRYVVFLLIISDDSDCYYLLTGHTQPHG